MTCQVILEFRLHEDWIEKLRTWMRKILPDTRGYDDCVTIHLLQNQDEPMAIAVIEHWESRQIYEKYLAWRTDMGIVDELVAMMAGEPSFRFFDFFGVEGR